MDADTTKDSVIQLHLLSSTIINYAGKLFTLAVGFFLTPFVLHSLGASMYGLWILVSSVVAYGALLDLGISSAISKYIAEYHARGETQQARALVATGLWLYSGLGLLAILLSILLSVLFPLLFSLPPEQSTLAVHVVLLSGVSLGISIPCTTPMAVLRGLQRYDIINTINAAGTLAFGFATVAVLLLGGGLLGMVAITIPLTLLIQIPAVRMIHRIAPELRFGWRGAELGLVRSVASFSWALFVTNVASQGQTETDEIIIGARSGIANITPYAIARRLSVMPQILSVQLLKAIMPLASQLHAEQDRARLRSLYLASTRLTLLSFVPLACGIVLLGGPFLTVWVGAEYAQYMHLVIILLAASLINTSQWPAASVLQGMAKHKWLAAMSLGSATVNLALSLVLIGPFGLAGVAFATLIPTVIECLFFVLPYAMRINDVSARVAIMEMFLPALLPAIPMVAALYWLQELVHPDTYILIALVGSVGLLVYGGGYLLFGATTTERQVIKRFVTKIIQFSQARRQNG